MKDLNKKIGKLLRKRRVLMKMSQKTLAYRMGAEPTSVCHYESGHTGMKLEKLILAADILGVRLGYFLDGVDVNLDEKDPREGEIRHAFRAMSERKKKMTLEFVRSLG